MCLFSKLRTNILNPYYAIAELNKIVNGTLEYDCTKLTDLTGRISFIRTFGVQVPTTMTSATRTTILLTMLTSPIRSGNYRKR